MIQCLAPLTRRSDENFELAVDLCLADVFVELLGIGDATVLARHDGIWRLIVDHEDGFDRGRRVLLADPALAPEDRRALEAAFRVATARRGVYPDADARPCGVLRSGEMNMGCTEPAQPWADAVAER